MASPNRQPSESRLSGVAEAPLAHSPGSLGRWLTAVIAAALLSIVAAGVYYNKENILSYMKSSRIGWPSVIISVVLALLPTAICLAQTVTRKRLLAKLDSVSGAEIATTEYYKSAQRAFDSIVPAAITGDYSVPLLMNVLTNFMLFLSIFNGFVDTTLLKQPIVMLVGVLPADPKFDLLNYQQSTFSVISAAFLGNYIYTLAQLLSRVNNNDLFPISIHFYSARAVIAMFTACIFRHAFPSFGSTNTESILLLGFATGLAPDLFIVAISRRAFQALKVWGSRSDGDAASRPTSLSLLQIDDLTRDKIDRLSELGIDSAHALSRQNPFLIWAKLPYDAGLILDWIAQAQLYVIVRDERMQLLRTCLVTDIFDLRLRLEGDDAALVLKALGLAEAKPLVTQIEADEAFKRLGGSAYCTPTNA